jgi:hypothetical protein
LRVKEVDVAESEFDAVKKIGTAKARSTDWYHQETIDTASMSIRHQIEDYVRLINTEYRVVSPAIAVHLKWWTAIAIARETAPFPGLHHCVDLARIVHHLRWVLNLHTALRYAIYLRNVAGPSGM